MRKTEDFGEVYTQSTGPWVSCSSHNSIISFTHKALDDWSWGIMPLSHLNHQVYTQSTGPLSHLNHQLYTQSTGSGVSCSSHTSIIRFTHKALGPGYYAPLTTQSSALHTKHWSWGIMPLSQLHHQLYTQSTGPDPSGHSMAWHMTFVICPGVSGIRKRSPLRVISPRRNGKPMSNSSAMLTMSNY